MQKHFQKHTPRPPPEKTQQPHNHELCFKQCFTETFTILCLGSKNNTMPFVSWWLPVCKPVIWLDECGNSVRKQRFSRQTVTTTNSSKSRILKGTALKQRQLNLLSRKQQRKPLQETPHAARLWTPPSDISSASHKPRSGPTCALEQNRQNDTDNAAVAGHRDFDWKQTSAESPRSACQPATHRTAPRLPAASRITSCEALALCV